MSYHKVTIEGLKKKNMSYHTVTIEGLKILRSQCPGTCATKPNKGPICRAPYIQRALTRRRQNFAKSSVLAH